MTIRLSYYVFFHIEKQHKKATRNNSVGQQHLPYILTSCGIYFSAVRAVQLITIEKSMCIVLV